VYQDRVMLRLPPAPSQRVGRHPTSVRD